MHLMLSNKSTELTSTPSTPLISVSSIIFPFLSSSTMLMVSAQWTQYYKTFFRLSVRFFRLPVKFFQTSRQICQTSRQMCQIFCQKTKVFAIPSFAFLCQEIRHKKFYIILTFLSSSTMLRVIPPPPQPN